MVAPRTVVLRIVVSLAIGISVAAILSGRVSLVRAQSSQDTAAPTGSTTAAPQSSSPSAPASEAAEVNQNEAPLSLRARTELIPVRVVVRDKDGRPVAGLHKEDFEVFQDRKRQEISNFVAEKIASSPTPSASVNQNGVQQLTAPATPFTAPARFVALVFDDEFSVVPDLMQARNAAVKYVDTSVNPTDRIAVFTVSGLGNLDFTGDHGKLHAALARLEPHPLRGFAAEHQHDCPPMDYFEADKVENQNDKQAQTVALNDVVSCDPHIRIDLSIAAGNNTGLSTADTEREKEMVHSVAIRALQEGSNRVEAVFRVLRASVRRLSAMPGQRNLVLISPGFIYPDNKYDFSDVVDQAIRSNVFISTLDARGLYAPKPAGDISDPPYEPDPASGGPHALWRITSQSDQQLVLSYLADDTGGFSFQNNNDLVEGLRQVVSAPEAYYYIGFVPQNLKLDGKFHSLKLRLRTGGGYTLQARRGFFAPLRGSTPPDVAREDIEDAVFSQEEQHGLPVILQTQFYKKDALNAKLSVVARVDLAHVRFEKADGRNLNDFTVVAALFDRNGNFITGTEKTVTLRLRDETLKQLSNTGVTVRTNFDVTPGDYVVRLVVRDSQAAQLSAQNGVVDIPY